MNTSLSDLLTAHWEAWMRWDPLFATACGDPRYNDRLPEAGEPHYQDWLDQLRAFHAQLGNLDPAGLAPEDRLNYEIFAATLENEIAELGYRGYRLPISKAGGFHVALPEMHLLAPFDRVQDYENYLARLRAVRQYLEQSVQLLRGGLESGFLPAQVTLEGVDQSLEAQCPADPSESAFFQPFRQFPAAISAADQARLRAEGLEAIRASVIPGYQGLLAFLNTEYLPAAREEVAAADLPEGRAFYQSRIRYFTTLDLTPESIHQTGLDEVRRIRAEMEAVIASTGFRGDFQSFLTFLRTDPRFYVTTAEALLKETAYLMKRVDGELPRLFKTLPRLPYGLRPIPDFSAPGSTAAYYFLGAGDGTKAGFYYVNTYDLASRPLYEIEALSLHEAVPGHHLQLALQQELTGLPSFRRFSGFTSFVEGWALYAERLGLEMGFYTDPYSNFGRLSYEMWRACRLVVDTGMHALGWTRQQAIDFMAENTSSTLLNITNEIDRYIAWPGQALAYKLGELKIRALRARAEETLGARFNVREFHDVVLLAGAVPLTVLEARVEAWISSLAGA
jgi:uncharacterized protein (DUF885 family)